MVEEEAVAIALERLIACLPRSSTLEEMVPAPWTEPALGARIADALARLVVLGHCAISTEPVVCASRLAERPLAWPVAAMDAAVAGCSLIGVLQSSILEVDVLAGVTVLFGVGSMSPHHGCQG